MTRKWDNYFLEMCNTVAKNSTCLSRQIGAVLTKDNIIDNVFFIITPNKIINNIIYKIFV